MELKEFIKNVLLDITNAVKESQHTSNNGALIVPDNVIGMPRNENKPLSFIEFEIAVTVEDTKEKGNGIKVLSSFIGGNINKNEKNLREHVSTIKFSIPVVFPLISQNDSIV